jgi:hypothetical protein
MKGWLAGVGGVGFCSTGLALGNERTDESAISASEEMLSLDDRIATIADNRNKTIQTNKQAVRMKTKR